ncbi:MAG: type II toxin-antitoxin system HicA family toxin [Methanobacteriaceae archaeon]|nr:type II toxin-antitoxin system HicA family toxin [Methanobacteriaceae archaeon]
MSKKLPVVSGKQAVRVLVKLGFVSRLGKGDHVVLQKNHIVLSVPLHKTLKKGTLRKILKHAGISVEEFNEAL